MLWQALEAYNAVYGEYRNFFIHSQVKRERSYISKIETDPKLFYSYIRGKKVGNPSAGPLKLSDGTFSNDCEAMAEVFADAFSSVFVSDSHQHDLCYRVWQSEILEIEISLHVVWKTLSSLNASSSMGPDGIHPFLLRSCPALAIPIYLVFKESLELGLLPSAWKISDVVPMFKKGVRSDPLNYRPISLTSSCCKSLERVIVNGLYSYLEENDMISSHQYGFRRGYSTEDQLLLVYEEVSRWVDGVVLLILSCSTL